MLSVSQLFEAILQYREDQNTAYPPWVLGDYIRLRVAKAALGIYCELSTGGHPVLGQCLAAPDCADYKSIVASLRNPSASSAAAQEVSTSRRRAVGRTACHALACAVRDGVAMLTMFGYTDGIFQ